MSPRGLLLSLSLFATLPTLGLFAQDVPAGLPPAAADAYTQGLDAEHHQFFDIALAKYQAASKQAPTSQPCMEAIERVQVAMGDDKSALLTLAKMVATAPDSHSRSHAEGLQAALYYRQFSGYTKGGGAYEKDPRKAQDALHKSEAAMQHATQDDPANEPQRMMYAYILASLHRDADASREFTACAAIPGTSPAECTRATRLSKDAELARHEPAPSFKATTIDGQPISLDGLAGKVVLVDFWGTWCPYCMRDSEYVQSMLASFDPNKFVLLEINVGDSHERWSSYVKDQRLRGTQVQDSGRQLESLFSVSGFPTYIIFDADGLIQSRYEGARGDLRGDLRKLLPAATPPPTSGTGQ